jgi:hypothetical protein
MYANTTGPVIFNIPYFCKVSMAGNDFRFTFRCVKHHVRVEVECACSKCKIGKNRAYSCPSWLLDQVISSEANGFLNSCHILSMLYRV